GLTGAVGPSPLIMTTLGVFVIPVTADTGWSRSQVTAAFGLAALGMAIGFPIVGWLLKKFTLRTVALPGLIGFTVSVALIGLLGHTFPLFALFFGLQGMFGSATGIPFAKATVSWFDNKRGIAIGIQAGIAAIGTTTLPIYASFLVSQFGWNNAYVVLAATSALVSISSLLLLVRVRAERSVRGRLVETVVENDKVINLVLPGATFRGAIRTRHFWMIATALSIAAIVINGLQISLVPMLVEGSIDASAAAALLSVLGVFSLIGRIGGGLLLDRVHGTIIGAIVIVAPAAGLLFLHAPFISALIASAFIGLAIGLEADLLSFFITRYLGTRAFPQILGVTLTLFLVGTAVGPQIFSASYDRLGSYDPVIPWMIGALAVSAGLVLGLGRYRFPAVAGFDKAATQDEFGAAGLLATQTATSEDEALKPPPPGVDNTARASRAPSAKAGTPAPS
ncbi:MFS transporter, partial [Dactylosporangium sp. NPDC005572]|uniref:MFS transporter n=1 Tax=Dactylosporangium sp. NPDC005572 TaxID=3156889 RepID=UPI00339ECF06